VHGCHSTCKSSVYNSVDSVVVIADMDSISNDRVESESCNGILCDVSVERVGRDGFRVREQSEALSRYDHVQEALHRADGAVACLRLDDRWRIDLIRHAPAMTLATMCHERLAFHWNEVASRERERETERFEVGDVTGTVAAIQ